MSDENSGPVRVAQLDEVSKALLGALAEQRGISPEELAGQLIRRSLTEIAREAADGEDDDERHH